MIAKKQAFSLIELSIVILLIGILISGIVKGTDLIQDSRIASAMSVTTSSPVVSTPDLTLWLETSGAFNQDAITTSSSRRNDGEAISAWHDINPQLKKKKTLSQATTDRQPNYVKDGINGLPSLKFDIDLGQEDYLSIVNNNTPIPAGDDSYTIFVVWQSDERPQSYFNGFWSALVMQGIHDSGRGGGIAISSVGKLAYFGHSNTYTPSISAADYEPNENYLLAVSINNDDSANARFFINGFMSQGNSSNANTASIAAQDFTIGTNYASKYSGGLFSEVIIFRRDLTNAEITAINKYLGKKYNITLDINV